MRTSWLPKMATTARIAFARIGEAGRRPATVRELILFMLLIFSLLWLSHRREIAYVVTEPDRGHVITLDTNGDHAIRTRLSGRLPAPLAELRAGLEAISTPL